MDELSGKRDEVIGDLMNVGRIASNRLVDITEPRSNWIVHEQNVRFTNLAFKSNWKNRLTLK